MDFIHRLGRAFGPPTHGTHRDCGHAEAKQNTTPIWHIKASAESGSIRESLYQTLSAYGKQRGPELCWTADSLRACLKDRLDQHNEPLTRPVYQCLFQLMTLACHPAPITVGMEALDFKEYVEATLTLSDFTSDSPDGFGQCSQVKVERVSPRAKSTIGVARSLFDALTTVPRCDDVGVIMPASNSNDRLLLKSCQPMLLLMLIGQHGQRLRSGEPEYYVSMRKAMEEYNNDRSQWEQSAASMSKTLFRDEMSLSWLDFDSRLRKEMPFLINGLEPIFSLLINAGLAQSDWRPPLQIPPPLLAQLRATIPRHFFQQDLPPERLASFDAQNRDIQHLSSVLTAEIETSQLALLHAREVERQKGDRTTKEEGDAVFALFLPSKPSIEGEATLCSRDWALVQLMPVHEVLFRGIVVPVAGQYAGGGAYDLGAMMKSAAGTTMKLDFKYREPTAEEGVPCATFSACIVEEREPVSDISTVVFELRLRLHTVEVWTV